MRIVASSLALAAILGLAAPAQAWEAGDWVVWAGASNIDPKSDNGSLDLTGLGLGTPEIEVDSQIGVTFGFTYLMTENWGLDVLAALPYTHDIELAGVGKVGEVSHLPPTVSLQYRFLPDSSFQPYLGAGLNVTLFFDEEASGALKEDLGGDLSVDSSSFGFAAQAGFDFLFNEQWFLKAEVRWIDINTDADVSVTTPVNATVSTEVEIDPIVYGLHLGYRF